MYFRALSGLTILLNLLLTAIVQGHPVPTHYLLKPNRVFDGEKMYEKRNSFKATLDAGVNISMGGDVGVYTHGDNARELELMVDYGMKPMDVLHSATSVNADVFGISTEVGRIKTGLLADIIAVEGNPATSINNIRKVAMVMKGGEIVKVQQR